jgi:hypothetical protein
MTATGESQKRVYLRLIRESGTDDADALRNCLALAPGIKSMIEISSHPRGGLSAIFMLQEGEFARLSSYLLAHGYRLVI